MRLERQNQGRNSERPGPCHQHIDDGLVPEVNSIKIANRKDAALLFCQVRKTIQPVHSKHLFRGEGSGGE